MSFLHSASLLHPSYHPSFLLYALAHTNVDRHIIEHFVRCTTDAIDYAMGRGSSDTSGRRNPRSPLRTSFAEFATGVIQKSQVTLPIILVALVYIERSRQHLSIELEQWACERIFLGALVVASKYVNDTSPKNAHWAAWTGLFGKRDIGRVEREFLDVLDWELSLQESDIIAQHNLLLATTCPTQPPTHHHRYQFHAGNATRRSFTFDFDDDSDWSDSEDESSSSSESDVAPRTPVHSDGPQILQGPRERPIVSPNFVMYDTRASQKQPRSRNMYPSMPHPSLQLELPDPIDSIAFVPTHVF
ncbi:hypothetical protein BDM02DRAFT_3166264 [Thelephora ganbajun]|uniref:Uncharacterized protein n=1 Tax=Thelephora ganbajun TaxID=370292 RepID=A0ACB6ZJK4_THEGA|nr:hypothetical protein BDM02DRAFT_3166264 [Thelephora ganbajun]